MSEWSDGESSGGPSDCPHCNRPIIPQPKRSRLCPHCREPIVVRLGHLFTETQAKAFDRERDRLREAKGKARAVEYLRERRAQVAYDLRQAKEGGVVSGVKLLVSSNDCDVCLGRRHLIFPIRTCTREMLPPYTDCEYEDGCRSSYTFVLDEDRMPWVKKSVPKEGFIARFFRLVRLGFIVFICLIVLMLWIGSRR